MTSKRCVFLLLGAVAVGILLSFERDLRPDGQVVVRPDSWDYRLSRLGHLNLELTIAVKNESPRTVTLSEAALENPSNELRLATPPYEVPPGLTTYLTFPAGAVTSGTIAKLYVHPWTESEAAKARARYTKLPGPLRTLFLRKYSLKQQKYYHLVALPSPPPLPRPKGKYLEFHALE